MTPRDAFEKWQEEKIGYTDTPIEQILWLAYQAGIELQHSELPIGCSAPSDFAHPDWQSCGKVHEWKNYISHPLRDLWSTFTKPQKAAIAANAEEIASNEEWE